MDEPGLYTTSGIHKYMRSRYKSTPASGSDGGLGIPTTDIESYATVTVSTLTLLHWAAGLDGNDMEFVLAPPVDTSSPGTSSSGSAHTIANAPGTHAVWVECL